MLITDFDEIFSKRIFDPDIFFFIYIDEINVFFFFLTTNLMVYIILRKNHLFKQYI